MKLTEIYEFLCYRDPRNPSSSQFLDDYDEHSELPRVNCDCNNCFTSSDKLALEILRLRNIVETSNPLR